MDRRVQRDAHGSWIEDGRGPVIMPLCGLLGGPEDWSALMRHFVPSYRVIVPVLPIGETSSGPESVDALAKMLIGFIDAHDLREVNLVGNSLGGQLALLVADAVPSRVRTLTLAGSAGLGENYGPFSVTRGERTIARDDYELIRRMVRSAFHDPRHATEERIEGIYRLVNFEPERASKLIAIARSSRRLNVSGMLGRIRQPTCLIWGREDQIAPPDTAERFRQALPNAALYWIDGCGHAPMIEHPEIFNALLARWLGLPGGQVMNRELGALPD